MDAEVTNHAQDGQMTVSASKLVPGSLQPLPFRLPWSRTRTACRPVIGDALLLQYPEVAKDLAEGSRSEEAGT